ncbi:MAG: ribosomal protein S18-alanine N-acetyltransferase [Magnetococcales bacterium]|nr:ribosomal protein S18-alanine N-acetyltransferase [Magnetococcales bacterium]
MIQADVSQVAQLEAEITPSPWTPGMFYEELSLGSYCRTLEDAFGTLLGYSVARLLVDEWHLLTLGISLAYRRQGGAKLLLADLIQRAKEKGHPILLEVRASNLPARTLYQDMGFHFLYTRQGYYRFESGTEDAILLRYAPA